jgi:probable F420-dependent oxidoreductase
VKVDTILASGEWPRLPDEARRLEEAGYDAAWTAEVSHDPFLPLAVAAGATSRISLGTSIAVAFARSPMTTAYTANDLQAASRGRFMLGLGSQVKAHVTRRFSMPWGRPAAQMREYVLALRAIWASWNEGRPLDVRGEYYQHTLMTAMFRPAPNPYGPPRVFLAAVGAAMTRVAGEVADGLVVHGFTTERYLREVTLPALERGGAKASKTRADLEVSYPGFVVTGETEEAIANAARATKAQIAFYGSTPAYHPVLELHGWGDLGLELNRMSKQGQWVAMGELIDDEMLEAFAVVAPLDEVPARVVARFGDVVDRFSFYTPYRVEPERFKELLAGFRAQ